MSIAASLTNSYQGTINTTSGEQIVRGPLVLTGNYGSSSSHGDTLDFSKIYGIQSRQPPSRCLIYQQPAAGTAPGNCTGTFCPGTTNQNGVVSFANAGTELTGGVAYTGATASAKWFFEATFPIFL